ncbi:MAG: GDP-mannose 4,6-dehydratase [Hyphomicrobiaceae bacterium]|nr:GDP-mannose 4,6-dehydratase [Hyphomicrobiaceae bacterium]
MRILITGGAGCLGSNLIERYLPQGHEILVIDNFATGQRAVVPDGVDGLSVVEGSIVDDALVRKCFADFEPTHVIHSAAAYKDPDDWGEDAATNVTGSIIVARAAEDAGVSRLINFQTALTYGRPDQVPIPETAPSRPFTSYGISKTAGEEFMMMSTVPTVSLRLANISGPRLAIGPIPTFYTRLKEGKSCFCSDTKRDFLDMEDFFSVMDAVMQEDAPTGVFNVSTGEGKSIKDVFDAVVTYLGVELEGEVPIVPPGDDDVPEVVLDAGKSERELGWTAKIGFEETINRMLAWYDAHGVSAVYSHLKAPDAAKA